VDPIIITAEMLLLQQAASDLLSTNIESMNVSARPVSVVTLVLALLLELTKTIPAIQAPPALQDITMAVMLR
jgi:hypothetical protein